MSPETGGIAQRLLIWFEEAARDLPWRRTTDPYAIWVSEIMLQQTQVNTVIPYWLRWMKALPTLAHLARADAGSLHKLWEGLGYYTRVRNMQAAAKLMIEQHAGIVPQSHVDLLALPGIGPYTAGAICSIAFNQPTPILDGNVARLLSRAFGVPGDPATAPAREHLWQLSGQVLIAAKINRRPRRRVYAELNQALMELGALICLPREPRCPACPIRSHCFAYRNGRVGEFPTPRVRPLITAKRFVAFALSKNSTYLVRQRPAGLVNSHLWEFPNIETEEEDPARIAQAAGLRLRNLSALATITHSITRYRITLHVYRGEDCDSSVAGGQWRTLRQMRRLPFSSAHKRIIEQLTK